MIPITRRDRDGGEQTSLKQQRVSLRGVFVWDVNSTVTKHTDYFVWKDTSERVAQGCDDTGWQEASAFLFTKTLLLWKSLASKNNRQQENALIGFLNPRFARLLNG